jgi:hypothetical protein
MNPASNVNTGYHVNRDYQSWIGGGQPLSPWANTAMAPSMPYTAMSPMYVSRRMSTRLLHLTSRASLFDKNLLKIKKMPFLAEVKKNIISPKCK